VNSQLEKELEEKLNEVQAKLMHANVDRHESEREAKLKETLNNLQKIFPGMLVCMDVRDGKG
jgi:structural maintenance of chromosome 1